MATDGDTKKLDQPEIGEKSAAQISVSERAEFQREARSFNPCRNRSDVRACGAKQRISAVARTRRASRGIGPQGQTGQTEDRVKIKDKFSALPVSRQRKWQLRRKKENRCQICGQPSVTAMHCLKHAIEKREYERKRYNSLTYRLAAAKNGKGGKP